MIAAPLINKIGHRRTVMLGGLIAASGAFFASLVKNLAALYVTAGVLTGVKVNFSYITIPEII